jgi:hypothetical protein
MKYKKIQKFFFSDFDTFWLELRTPMSRIMIEQGTHTEEQTK